jgi:hypothetical protein
MSDVLVDVAVAKQQLVVLAAQKRAEAARRLANAIIADQQAIAAQQASEHSIVQNLIVPIIAMREANGLHIHSVNGVDLVSADPSTPGRFTVLRDFPQWGRAAGDVVVATGEDPLAAMVRDLLAPVTEG